ncbi:uncharacterized protein LOC135499039 [Lineus longissimus]|uniref:uncharacterized protein LOC135499039 n=1 Tax=Lineus longissimus TaxID=88925 RepID=UPI00315D67A2
MSSKSRVKFTDHQRKKLIQYYKDGLKTTNKNNHSKIEEVAKELGLMYKNVKMYCIPRLQLEPALWVKLKCLEKWVREALDTAYCASTGRARFPYSDHHKGMVTVHGLPDGLQIPRSTGSMGKAKMAELLAVITNLKFVLNILHDLRDRETINKS